MVSCSWVSVEDGVQVDPGMASRPSVSVEDGHRGILLFWLSPSSELTPGTTNKGGTGFEILPERSTVVLDLPGAGLAGLALCRSP